MFPFTNYKYPSLRPDEFSKDAVGWVGTQEVMKTVG